MTWKHNSFTKSPLGHSLCYWGCRIDCSYHIWVWSHQWTSKWPQVIFSVLKTKLFDHQISLRACNMFFYRYFLRFSIYCTYKIWFWSCLLTSKWSQVDIATWKHNSLTKYPLEHMICLFILFGTRLVNWVWSHQITSKWPLNDLKWLHLSDLILKPSNDLQTT